MFFKRNGDDNTGANVRAAPALSAAPKFQANVKIFVYQDLYVMANELRDRALLPA